MNQELQKRALTVCHTGGRLTKWKGRVVSVASALGAVTLCATLTGAATAEPWPNIADDTITELGAHGSRYSRVHAVSADGSVIVGTYETTEEDRRAVSWVDGSTTATDLGTLGGEYSFATAVIADGSVIVGYALTTERDSHAVSWVDGSTTATDLGTLGGRRSYAHAVSADGSVIVGYALTTERDNHAVSWVDGSITATNLGTLGGTFGVANAVSADGSVIVGTARTPRAFIRKTPMKDLDILLQSFPTLANDTEIAAVQQQATASYLMGSTCLAEAGSGCLRVEGMATNTGADDAEVIGSRSNSDVIFSYGRGLSNQLTIGGALAINGTSLHNNGFDQDNGFGVSIWTKYSASGTARTGVQAGADIGHVRDRADISRGRGIENVMLATGESDLKTTSARASLGYGFQQQDWLLTPNATLEHFETRRSAYAETGGDFNATYDSFAVSRTTLTLEMNAERKVSKRGTLSLGAGLEHDLSADRVTFTGSSELASMQDFSISSSAERRKTRGFATVGYTHDFGNNRALTSSLRVGQSAFGSDPQIRAGISFTMGF